MVEVWKMRARLFHKDCEVELGSNTFLQDMTKNMSLLPFLYVIKDEFLK